MRILLDANLSPRICPRLQDAGHDASHVVEHGLLSASDEEILKFAASVEAIVVSADSDFAMLLALGGSSYPVAGTAAIH
jgi:predicted nuclease of predicted toxin-antitoxin system